MAIYRSIRIILLLLLLSPAADVAAQSVSLGADIVSRYVWRGTDFGESVSIQPSLSVASGGFEIGSWASYAAGPTSAGFNEHDLWVSYSVETSGGAFTLGVTDYFFPAPFNDDVRDPSTEFFNFDGGGSGAHWIEPFVQYQGPTTFPVSLLAAAVVHNDPDRSLYLEGGFPFAVDGVSLDIRLGAVPMKSAFYGTSGVALVNASLAATRAVSITESLSIPISVAYIVNPYMERSFLVFGISL